MIPLQGNQTHTIKWMTVVGKKKAKKDDYKIVKVMTVLGEQIGVDTKGT